MIKKKTTRTTTAAKKTPAKAATAKAPRAKMPALATGQLWQTKECFVQIARVGKTLAEYKMLRKPGQRGAQSQMGNVPSVEAYLKKNKAELISTVTPKPKPMTKL